MALRILWDEYESALLLSELLRVLNGEISRKDAVKNVSETLRKRAVARGIEIDDVFRNENGIQLQMRAMEFIFTDGASGLEKPSAMFHQTVDLYRTDKEKFYKILQGERPMATKKRTLEEPFIAWLSTRVSSKDLSDFYLRFTEVGAFLRDSGEIKETFFEITDPKVLSKIKMDLDRDKVFLREHRLHLRQIKDALYYYGLFLTFEAASIDMTDAAEAVPNASESPQLEAGSNGSESLEFNLCGIPILEYTKPVFFSYFGEIHSEISSWKQLYVEVMKCLLEDYPDTINQYMNRHLGDGSRPDFADEMRFHNMKAPRKVIDNFYIETNFSASDIVNKLKRIFDVCLIDHENLVVGYAKIPEDKAIAATKNMLPEDDVHTARKQFMTWLQGQGIAVGTAMAYTSSIKQCTKAANEEKITDENLFLICAPEELKCIKDKLIQSVRFKQENLAKKHACIAALNKLILFRNETQEKAIESATKEEAKPIPAQEIRTPRIDVAGSEKYIKILEKYFSENGYQPGRAIARARFRKFYLEEYGTDVPNSDEQMEGVLRKIGVMRDGRIYPKQDEAQNELVDQILADIQGAFQEGASAVYVRAVYEKYEQPLLEEMHIYQADALTPVLLENKKIKLYLQYNSYFTNQCGIGDTEKDLERLMKEFHVPQTYAQIHEKLWYVPFDKMKSLLASNKSMIRVSQGTYFYAPNFPISPQEQSALAAAIQEKLHYRSFITGVELLSLIREKFPSIAANAEAFPDAGIRDCLGYLLRNRFAFRGAIISATGTELQMGDVFAEFARSHETLPVDELKSFAGEMNAPIYWDAVLEEMVRVSEDLLVRKERIVFDVPKIDAILEELCPQQYMPLKEIQLFLQFPNIGYPWNTFVLESYLFIASRKFRLLHNCFGATAACGVIVRANAAFADYEEVLTDALSRSNALGSTKAALQYLVDAGFQQKRVYAGIERVLQTAKLQKEQREKEEK